LWENDALEEQGVIGNNNVEFIKLLAVTLGLDELEEKVDQYESDCCGKFY
jgi:hypothetical protein